MYGNLSLASASFSAATSTILDAEDSDIHNDNEDSDIQWGDWDLTDHRREATCITVCVCVCVFVCVCVCV